MPSSADAKMSGDVSTGKYIIAVDIGTTVLRCHIYDSNAEICGEAYSEIDLLFPKQGHIEINPDELWDAFVQVVKNGIKHSSIDVSRIAGLGISCQRGTFTTWNRQTGKPFHNFITWKDVRADKICHEWNKSFRMKCLRNGARFLYFFTRMKRFQAASVLKLTTGMVVSRLIWALENFPEIREQSLESNALFGTIDTWLLWKMTKGAIHATDSSAASVSGMFDPFQMRWANWVFNMFNIPSNIMPEVKDTSGEFGRVDPNLFGISVPVTAMVGDQQASMFAECCFEVGDAKCTLGTGSFINVNTGAKAEASFYGLYPVVGWKIGNEITYLIEGSSFDTGTVIKWAQKLGLFVDPAETSDMAYSVPDSGGVYFVPSFSGIQAPINDNLAVTAFLGLKEDTTAAHLVRAILESLAFRVKQMYELVLEEVNIDITYLRVDGGVSCNDFLMQLISDLMEQEVDRPKHKDMSCLGAAFLAGMAVGMWKNKDELVRLRESDKVFTPQGTWESHYRTAVIQWERAVHRCLGWYSEKWPKK